MKTWREPGIRPRSEAGKKVPELATLFRILEALNYGLAALDRADEFCLALRLIPRCRTSLALSDPLRGQIESLAAEAGNAVSRLTDAIALLAGLEPTSGDRNSGDIF